MAAPSIAHYRRCRSLLLSLSPLLALFACCCAFRPTLAQFPSLPGQLSHCKTFPANISSVPPTENHLTFPMPADDDDNMSLTLFPQLSFDLSDIFLNSSFTLTSYNHSKRIAPPSLVFFILPSPSPAPSSARWEVDAISHGLVLCFDCTEDNSTSRPLYLLLDICNVDTSLLPDIQVSDHSSVPTQLEQDIFKDELSIEYNAITGALYVVAARYQENQKITISFVSSTRPASKYLIVGYITDREATNNITTNYSDNEPITYISVSNSPSTHNIHHDVAIIVWIILGTFLLPALVIGLVILALVIKKCNENRPKASSSLASHGATTPPKSFHRNSKVSELPMMESPPVITPPCYNAFQVSGSASWLKPPTPR